MRTLLHGSTRRARGDPVEEAAAELLVGDGGRGAGGGLDERRRGDWIGYVLAGDALRTVRVAVGQDDIDRVRSTLLAIEAMPADRIGTTYAARLVREVPAGDTRLPSRALTVDGGGQLAADPRGRDGTETLSRQFQFDLELPAGATTLRLGTRVYVRFAHPPEPLAVQCARRLRQLFLSRLHV